MRGSIRRETNGTYTVIYDAGDQPRLECSRCSWRDWASAAASLRRCPECDGNVATRKVRRQFKRRGFKRQADAEGWVAEQLVKVESGTHVDPSKMTLREFIEDQWLPHREATRSPNTAKKDREVMQINVLPYLGETRLQELKAFQVQDLLDQLKLSGGARRQGLGPKSRHHVYATLNKTLNDAEARGIVLRKVDETVRYASEADAALSSDWVCPSCGSAVAEMVEFDHGSAAGNDQQ